MSMAKYTNIRHYVAYLFILERSAVMFVMSHIISCFVTVTFKTRQGHTSRLQQKWFISVRGESKKNAIEVSRCCGLCAQPGSRYI